MSLRPLRGLTQHYYQRMSSDTVILSHFKGTYKSHITEDPSSGHEKCALVSRFTLGHFYHQCTSCTRLGPWDTFSCNRTCLKFPSVCQLHLCIIFIHLYININPSLTFICIKAQYSYKLHPYLNSNCLKSHFAHKLHVSLTSACLNDIDCMQLCLLLFSIKCSIVYKLLLYLLSICLQNQSTCTPISNINFIYQIHLYITTIGSVSG